MQVEITFRVDDDKRGLALHAVKACMRDLVLHAPFVVWQSIILNVGVWRSW